MAKKKAASGSDVKKVDTHFIQPHEYDEIPELGDEWFAAADLHEGGKLLKHGLPKVGDQK